MARTCAYCRFYRQTVQGAVWGECREAVPVPIIDPKAAPPQPNTPAPLAALTVPLVIWPVVKAGDWCRAWEPHVST